MDQISILNFQAIFNAMPGNFLALQPNPPLYTILAISDDLLHITNLTREEVVGRSVFEVYPENPEAITATGPSSLPTSLQNATKYKKPDQMPVVRYDVPNAQGVFEERFWSANSKPVLDANGNVSYIIHATSDVTQQVKTEKKEIALRDLEKKYSLLIQAPVGVCIVTGPENIVELANEELLTVLGRTSAIIGKPLFESIPETRAQGFPELLDLVRKTGEPFYATEFPVKLVKHGVEELRYYNFVYQPYYENEGDNLAAGVFSVAHDVTEQVLARRKVEESELQVRSFIESSHHPIGVYMGREMRIQFANQALKDGLGKGNDIIGKLYKDVLPELENQQVFKQLEEVYTTGKPFHAKNHRLDLIVNGVLKEHFFDLSFTPLFNTAGEVYGVINTGADVTELNYTRERIAESEARYRTLIEEAPIATSLYLGPEIRIQYVNNIMLGYWGKDNSVLGKTFREALPELEDQPFPGLLEKVYKTGQAYIGNKEKAELLVDGCLQPFYFNFTYKPLFNKEGEVYGIHHTAVEVTQEVLVQKRLEESARDLQHMADAMPQLVWIAGSDGKVVYYNERIGEYAGSKKLSDGTWVWDSMLLTEDTEATVEAWNKAVREETVYDIEHRVKMKDGTYRWHLSRAFPQRDEEGKVIKWFGTATDVHQRKENEKTLELNNFQLVRINNDLDNFIYTASHDLKAPISNIEGLLDILSSDLSVETLQEDEPKHIIKLMQSSVDRFKKTIDSLTDVVKLQHANNTEATLVSLPEVIEEVRLDLEPMILATHATVEVDVANCDSIRFTKKNLRSIIYNLLSNAIKYHSPERLPQIRISCSASAEYHVLSVEDNGLGIDSSLINELFTIFRRFHDHVEGTGIGLYMVKKIVENAGGKITVESNTNTGTIFRVFLPH